MRNQYEMRKLPLKGTTKGFALLLALGAIVGFVPASARANDEETSTAAIESVAESRPASAPAVAREPDPVKARAAYRAALATREAGNIAGYRRQLEEARRLLPDPSNLWFRLAGARVLAGDRTGAFEALEAQLSAGMVRPDFSSNPDLLPLHEHLRWAPIAEAHARLSAPVVASTEEFRLVESGLLVEGIARDPVRGDLYLSVVNRRSILRRSADGALSVFATLAGKLPGSPLGLAVDSARRRLWVVSAGLPHGEGTPDSEKGRGALGAFDLATGELVEAMGLAGDGHAPNDLVIGASGTVYLSDPGTASIWRRSAAGAVERLELSGALVSPGGLALTADERLLYVADWSAGLAVVELATGELRWLAPPRGSTVLGIDGLVRSGSSLVAIQNGVAPARVTRFELAPDGRSLVSATLLERALPEWDEPTLGVFADAGGSSLLYIATSHWPRFGEDGKPVDPATLTPSSIRRLPLAPAR